MSRFLSIGVLRPWLEPHRKYPTKPRRWIRNLSEHQRRSQPGSKRIHPVSLLPPPGGVRVSVLEGRRIAPLIYQGGGKSEHHRARCRVTPLAEIHTGDLAARPVHGKCHRKQTAPSGVRVKRWGKSPPLQAQARRHGKPHRVQGQIGNCEAARLMQRSSERGRFRVRAA